MGVTGLWQLVSPVGKPVTLESLENKVLAVDVSIWLNQAMKGFRSKSGEPVAHAHLASLCNRICKLLFYRIKPIFVFDGATPLLKKQTVAARERQRQKSRNNSQNVAHRILTNYLATEVVQEGSKKKVPVKRKTANNQDDDIFHLPPLESEGSFENPSEFEEDETDETDAYQRRSIESHYQDLSSVDINSAEFKSLPPDIRYEILSEMKQNKRRNHHKPLPQDSEEFSNFQMTRLLERSYLQQSMDSAAKELNQHQVGELMQELCQEGTVVDSTSSNTHRIVSEDAALSLLIHTAPKPKEVPKEISSSTPSILEDINEFIISSSDEDSIEVMGSSEGRSKMINQLSAHDKSSDPKATPYLHITENYETGCSRATISEKVSDPVAQWLSNINSQSKPLSPTQTKPNNSSLGSDSDIHSLEENPIVSVENNNISKETNKEGPKKSNVTTTTIVNVSSVKNSQAFCLTSSNKSFLDSVLPPKENIPDSVPSSKENIPASVLSPKKSMPDSVLSPKKCMPDSASSLKNNALNSEKDFSSTLPQCSQKDSVIPVQNPKRKTSTEIPNASIRSTGPKDVTITVDLKSVGPGPPILDDLFPPEMFEDIQPKSPINCNLKTLLPKEIFTAATQEEALAVLEAEREQLMEDRSRHQRQAQTLSDQILLESQELLGLFGVPYVVSPTEAEAQCAILESLKLTQGTITDDSDIWLFGGRKVYRHFFQMDKYVQLYTIEDIQSHFGLDQDQLICFGMLTGSDYTEGVESVGAVKAMEILAEFRGKGLETLNSFKSWWLEHQKKKAPPGNDVRAKLISLNISQSFPREEVFKAYLNPEVDKSTEKFSWQAPDLCALRELLVGKLGWRMEKVNDMLLPAIKKFNQSQSQTRLDSFFTMSLKPETVLPPSKRLQRALNKFCPKEKKKKTKENTNFSGKDKPKIENKNVKMTRRKRGSSVQDASSSSSSHLPNPKVMRKNQGHSVLSESSSECD